MVDDDNDVPSLEGGPSLMEPQALEGSHVFRCADCDEIFDTVMSWAEHALEARKNNPPGIGVAPVRKQ